MFICFANPRGTKLEESVVFEDGVEEGTKGGKGKRNSMSCINSLVDNAIDATGYKVTNDIEINKPMFHA